MADAGARENDQDDRAKRREALSAIARTAPASATQVESDDLRVTSLDGSIYRKRRMRPAWRWGLMLALMALLVAGVYGYQRYTATRVAPIPPIARTLNIDLTLSALYCPQNIAWSPDSLSLAVIADAQNCGADGGYRPSTLDLALGIFDARTGALEKRFVIASASVVGKIVVPVLGVAWSHDGSTVYVTISGEDPAGVSQPASLLVAPVRGGHVQLYTTRSGESSQAGIIWNLKGLPSATTLSKPLAPAQWYTLSAGVSRQASRSRRI